MAIGRSRSPLWPALAAVGGACGLAANPAAALELGQIAIDSTLGQPLRASIAYALQPDETLAGYCIHLAPAGAASGIPGIGRPRIVVTDNAILLRGQAAVREPLLSMQLSVQCPHTARLTREYTLMIDPAVAGNDGHVAGDANFAPAVPQARPVQHAAPSRVATPGAPVTRVPAQRPANARSARPAGDARPAIASGGRYRVQPGDTLSQIVARIEGRTAGLWPAVAAIHAANPHAFLNNDPNLLRAGAWLDIPELGGTATRQPGTVVPETAPPALADLQVADIATTSASLDPAPIAQAAPAAAPPLAADTPPPDARPVHTPGSNAREVVVSIPDTSIDVTPTAAPAPVVVPAADAPGAWLRWTAGALTTAVLLLLIFGRHLRARLGARAAIEARAAAHRRRRTDAMDGRSMTPAVAEPAAASAPRAVVPQVSVPDAPSREPVHIDFLLPAVPAQSGMEIREIPPTDGTASAVHNFSGGTAPLDYVLEDEDATARDLATISGEAADISRFSLISDFERQVFAQDYEAAMIATGHFTKGFPGLQAPPDEASMEEEFKASKAS